jgi:hypothetical protein
MTNSKRLSNDTSPTRVKKAVQFEATYVLHPRQVDDSEFYIKTWNRFVEYFQTPREFRIWGSSYHDHELLRAQVGSCTQEMKDTLFKSDVLIDAGDITLIFSGKVSFPGPEHFYITDHQGKNFPRTKDELHSIWLGTFPHAIDLAIQTYLCALMIVFPGAARVIANVWHTDGKLHHFKNYYHSSIHEAVEFLTENGLLPLDDLTPDHVIVWVFSQNGIFDGYSDTPASRCLNYFTRLYVRQFRGDELSDLVWALAGIESLLVEGGRSSIGQLRENSEQSSTTKQRLHG